MIHVRRGPRRGIATAQDEAILNEKRRHGDQPFDVLPIPNTSISDLDLVTFERAYLPQAVSPEFLELNNRSIEEQLVATKMLASLDDQRATVLGILVMGKNPREILPNSYVQFLRIDGTNLWEDIIDSETVDGAIADLTVDSF